MGVDGENLQVIGVEVIMEQLSNTITLRYILTNSSDYGVCKSHCIQHLRRDE